MVAAVTLVIDASPMPNVFFRNYSDVFYVLFLCAYAESISLQGIMFRLKILFLLSVILDHFSLNLFQNNVIRLLTS